MAYPRIDGKHKHPTEWASDDQAWSDEGTRSHYGNNVISARHARKYVAKLSALELKLLVTTEITVKVIKTPLMTEEAQCKDGVTFEFFTSWFPANPRRGSDEGFLFQRSSHVRPRSVRSATRGRRTACP
jgi:hypothetical protein